MARLRIFGIRDSINRLRRIRSQLTEMVNPPLKKVAEDILRDARDLVPVDTGALKRSGKITKKGTPFKRNYVVTFGDTNIVDYAEEVHDDLLAYHKHGQAKYLEIPFRRHTHGLADEVRKSLRSGFIKNRR